MTLKASPNGREGVKMSHLDHQSSTWESLSHQNQLLSRLSDFTDVKINYKSNCNDIILLQRFRETGERDYEGGLGLSAFKKCLTNFVSARHFHNAPRIELFSESRMM